MATQLEATPQTPVEEALEVVTRTEHEMVTYIVSRGADGSKLFLEYELKQPGVPIITNRVALLGLLPRNVPTKLLHADVLEDIVAHLARGEVSGRRRVAKGVPPIPGRDGKLVLLVKAYSKTPGATQHVDPWFVKSFDNVEPDMPVARIYPPHPGTPGMDVLGNTVPPAPGTPINIETDESVAVLPPTSDKAFSTVAAKISGFLRVEKTKLQVVHDLVIQGDVDHQSGDINFSGKVVVRGNIMKNFRVTARDGIEITGDVLDGILSSPNGDIIVKGHVSGESLKHVTIGEGASYQQLLRMATTKPQITCGGSFKASTVDSVTVEAHGEIEVAKEARSSYLRSRTTVRVTKGVIVGGEVYAVCGLEAAILGTELETPTKVTLCSDQESTAEFAALTDQMKTHESAETMLRLYLGPYADNPARIRLLGPEHKRKMQKLRMKLDELQRSKAHLEREKAKLLQDARKNTVFRVNFHKLAHPGVTIATDAEHMTINEPITGPKTIEYNPADRSFAIVDQKPLECVLQAAGSKETS